jgi:hypothetical protein
MQHTQRNSQLGFDIARSFMAVRFAVWRIYSASFDNKDPSVKPAFQQASEIGQICSIKNGMLVILTQIKHQSRSNINFAA